MEIYAHDWDIIGKDRIRRWPSKIGEKRSLSVTITSWVGISIGAKHTYVHVEEQKNQWWSEKENAWVELSCDSKKGGYNLRADCMNLKEAVKTALFFVKLIDPEHNTHEVHWHGEGEPKWISKQWKE